MSEVEQVLALWRQGYRFVSISESACGTRRWVLSKEGIVQTVALPEGWR